MDETGQLYTTKAQRTGCTMCGFGIHIESRPHRFDVLRENNPREWEFWMKNVCTDENGEKYGWGRILDYIGVVWECSKMSFANKLKGLMEELDLTQAKVSDLTGIGRSSISQYVSGKNAPSKERRKEIARSLGVQDNYFEEYDPVATVQYNSTVNLPVELVAKLMKKSPRFVRRGLQDGVFPWGYAVKLEHWSYFISSVKFTECTGIQIPAVEVSA